MEIEDPRTTFHNLLLPRTLAYAANNILGYRYLLPFVEKVKKVTDLPKLQILHKNHILERPDEFRNLNLGTTFLQHTSGTEGMTLILHRCAEEVEFRNRFEVESMNSEFESNLIVVSIGSDTFHGTPMPVARPHSTFHLSPTDNFWMNHVHEIVQRPWEFVPCKPAEAILSGLESDLRLVTAILLQRGFNFSSSVIRGLVTTGDAIPEHLHKWYETTWGTPLVNRYSLSEVLAGAQNCLKCGWMHCDPNIIGEVVDPVTHDPIDSGVGVLLLTTLYPFVQKQPFIRYWTGDLVEVGNGCHGAGPAFKLEGRLKDCIVDHSGESTQLVWSAKRMLDAVSEFPEITLSEGHDPSGILENAQAMGHPKVRFSNVEKGSNHFLLEFEPNYNPILHPDHDANICDRLYNALLSRHPVFASSVAHGQRELEVRSVNGSLPVRLRPGRV